MSCRNYLNKNILLLLTLCTAQPKAEDQPPAAVQVQPVHYQQYARPIEASGQLSYKSVQTLSFKVSGPIESIQVEAGERIAKGQLLAQLAPEEIDAQVDEASARVSLAASNLARFQQLHKSNALSLEKLQAAETELTIAKSKLRIARFNQTYSRIHAPANGLVLKRHVEPNELVSPYQPIVVLANESKGWIMRGSVTDQDVVRISPTDQASIRFDALPGQLFSGKVTQITPMATSTGTFEIEISLTKPAAELRSGFIGQITIYPQKSDNVALIPLTAITQSEVNSLNQTGSVFIVSKNNDKNALAEQRSVTVAFISDGIAAITDGLKPNEQVITTGAGLLRHGEKVNVVAGVQTQ